MSSKNFQNILLYFSLNAISILHRLGEEWEEPVHTTTLSESHELLPDESDNEEEEKVAASNSISENEASEGMLTFYRIECFLGSYNV